LRVRSWKAVTIGAVLCFAGCQHSFSVKGAGSTFADPLYQEWIRLIDETYPGAQISYDPVGSIEGVSQLLNAQVDYAGSDVRLTADEINVAKTGRLKADVLQIPTAVGAVAPIYNRTEMSDTLNFSPAVLAAIFSGAIRKWDDPAIRRENPDAQLPHKGISVFRRSDGSGTTCIISDFLATAAPILWHARAVKMAHGREKRCQLDWSVGKGVEGSSSLVDAVRKTPYSIGYAEYSYAELSDEGGVDWGKVQNNSGSFVRASVATIRLAAKDLSSIPEYSLLKSSDPQAYPISALTWLIIPVPPRRDARQNLCVLLNWAVKDGQTAIHHMGYAELPPPLVDDERILVRQVCKQ
jgi:phosphate transport system substrate-binding protein